MSDYEWTDWVVWCQGPRPVSADIIVQVEMGNGDKLSPMRADGIDWDCEGDPVVKYRIRKPSALQAMIERAQALPGVKQKEKAL